MDNRQSFGACLGSLLSGILALVQVPAWGGLSGRRYEHIHVRLTEAIHGFRHSRKGLPKPAPMLRCRLPQKYAKDYWRQVPSLTSGCGSVFRKFAEPWMAEQKRHMDVPQGAVFGTPTHTCDNSQPKPHRCHDECPTTTD